GEIAECSIILVPDLSPSLQVRFDTLDLVHSYGRLQIHHVVLVSDFHDLVMLVTVIREPFPRILRHSMQRKYLEARGNFAVVGQHHTALTRNNILSGIKTQNSAITKPARLLPVIFCLDCVRAVLDDLQIMRSSEGSQRVHIAGPSCKMHWQYCLGPGSNF